MNIKKLMADRNSSIIEYYQSVLEQYGIKSMTKNISISNLGGILPEGEICPELWVLEEDMDKAKAIIEEMNLNSAPDPETQGDDDR